MNLAALDLGSNSFHLLVARRSAPSELEKVASHKVTLGLGAVVEAHGRLPKEVFREALAAVGSLASVARAFRSERILAVATSALRSATNGAEFVAAARQQHRIGVEMLSGEEEGELAYRGALSGFAQRANRVGVVDIGGGSVEIAVGDANRCELVESLPLGFLRLAHTLGANGALGAEALRSRVLARTQRLSRQLELYRPDVWLFSGGTARAFDKLLGATGQELPLALVQRAARDVMSASPERLRELGVDSARVETLPLACGVLLALTECIGARAIRVSPGGLREGVLLRELECARQGSGVRHGFSTSNAQASRGQPSH
jgi:exopolyphosphatase/guanosine-5'-triphosphate,3'-diphosphate pyrophosphatase